MKILIFFFPSPYKQKKSVVHKLGKGNVFCILWSAKVKQGLKLNLTVSLL